MPEPRSRLNLSYEGRHAPPVPVGQSPPGPLPTRGSLRSRARTTTSPYSRRMNFFGHAAVAQREREEPRFVLGAMLPDFCGMAGVRMSPPEDAALAEGVALHHATDRAFHAAPVFVSLCASALAQLEADGVARASARAVGHVG